MLTDETNDICNKSWRQMPGDPQYTMYYVYVHAVMINFYRISTKCLISMKNKQMDDSAW